MGNFDGSPMDGARDFDQAKWDRVYAAIHDAASIACGSGRTHPELGEFGIETSHEFTTHEAASAWFRDAFERLSQDLPPVEHAALTYQFHRRHASLDVCYAGASAERSLVAHLDELACFGFWPTGACMGVLQSIMPGVNEACGEVRRGAIEGYVDRWRRSMLIDRSTLEGAMQREDGSASFASKVRATLLDWIGEHVVEGDEDQRGDVDNTCYERSEAYFEGIIALDALLLKSIMERYQHHAQRDRPRVVARERFLALMAEVRHGRSHAERADLTRYQYHGLVRLDLLYLAEPEAKVSLMHDLRALASIGGLNTCENAAEQFMSIASAIDYDPDSEVEREIERFMLDWYRRLRAPSWAMDGPSNDGNAFVRGTMAKVREILGDLVLDVRDPDAG